MYVKQCCCIFKRKPDPWAFLRSNTELGEGDFFPQRHCFGNSFVVLRKVDMMGKTFSSSFVRDYRYIYFLLFFFFKGLEPHLFQYQLPLRGRMIQAFQDSLPMITDLLNNLGLNHRKNIKFV